MRSLFLGAVGRVAKKWRLPLHLPPQSVALVHFNDQAASESGFAAQIDCNSMEAPYIIEDGRFVADPDTFSHTLIDCDASAQEADDWLFQLLTSQPDISRDGDALTIAGEDSVVAFTRVASGVCAETWRIIRCQRYPPPSLT